MRIRLKTRPIVLFLAFFAVALVALLPMRLALSWAGLGTRGLTARSVTGSIWSATLRDVEVGAADMGDVRAALTPLPLIAGRASIKLHGASGAGGVPLNGALSVSRHAFAVKHLTASIDGGASFAPIPIARIDLDDVTARFADGGCDTAEGRVVATLSGAIGPIALPAAMSGNARCDGQSLLLPLTSTAGSEAITLHIQPEGNYTADLRLQAADPDSAQRLAAAGFTQTPSGYTLSITGTL